MIINNQSSNIIIENITSITSSLVLPKVFKAEPTQFIDKIVKLFFQYVSRFDANQISILVDCVYNNLNLTCNKTHKAEVKNYVMILCQYIFKLPIVNIAKEQQVNAGVVVMFFMKRQQFIITVKIK